MQQYHIENVEDIKQFFRDIHKIYPFEWHPDDDFQEFTDSDNVKVFDAETSSYLNQVMSACFQYCEDHDCDIYDIAGEVQIQVWREKGIWEN